MTDPITDMLNRIRNAQAVLKDSVEIPFSKLKYEIAQIMEKEGLIKKLEKKGKKEKKFFEITLNYYKDESAKEGKKPVILGLRRISKPGQRIYTSSRDIKSVRGGYGISIISTPSGLMASKEAKKKKLGGEIICEIW
ncbi:MAG: 30S ribosomal protein S8 [Candidatus Pacebacteria bacterium]|nr:30S ribosomal protein S8 [Candidatus Paceibacterota bacterium]